MPPYCRQMHRDCGFHANLDEKRDKAMQHETLLDDIAKADLGTKRSLFIKLVGFMLISLDVANFPTISKLCRHTLRLTTPFRHLHSFCSLDLVTKLPVVELITSSVSTSPVVVSTATTSEVHSGARSLSICYSIYEISHLEFAPVGSRSCHCI